MSYEGFCDVFGFLRITTALIQCSISTLVFYFAPHQYIMFLNYIITTHKFSLARLALILTAFADSFQTWMNICLSVMYVVVCEVRERRYECL